ncbi:agmatine deiminase family protein [Sulfurospirillum barnesii]|uniref:Peptidylarginine deiminase-like enzyme n=1 Tax=Sulfurospirillum barnesii (strain ATCC 700032 / DSM 10660 / SES-3) TaxID=760154 RepID=I3XYB0_SULBS|nr:agmatine deiminase family protein [Sulfurospirillum barnesii]AFL68934.1 peptidylarginine deiminase-like enzyme [Sulfurospirillum barnesii SES-3]
MKRRIPAEWEEQEALIVVFPPKQSDWSHSLEEIHHSYREFISKIARFQKCLVICEDKTALANLLPNLQNIELIQMQTNDTWIRDFGGINIYKNHKRKTYDFIFNAWGNKFEANLDNSITQQLFKEGHLKGKLKSLDFVLEGGSIDSNGHGVMLSTAYCLFEENRNPELSKKKIKKTLMRLFGLKKLIVLKHGALMGDDTDSHIDTLARFINKKTIAYVKCYDKEDEHYEELKKMEKELQKTGYDLLPLPLPSAKYFNNHRIPATYMNFVLINNAVLVPIYSDPYDEEVLEIFRASFPEREIVGIESSVFIREHGSLHCASMNIYTPRDDA